MTDIEYYDDDEYIVEDDTSLPYYDRFGNDVDPDELYERYIDKLAEDGQDFPPRGQAPIPAVMRGYLRSD